MKVKVYQIDSERDQQQVKFMGYDLTQKHGGVDPMSYRCVYSGEVDTSNLEDVYEKLNFGRPARFFGHSLSVSDIVEITEDTPDWKQFLNTDEGKAYFSARIKVAEAFADTLTRNMNAMSCTVIDPLSDANYVERRNLYTFMNGRNLSTPEEMKPYLTPLINAYASKVDEDFLKNYGWTRGDLCAVISGNLDPKELTEYVPRGSGEDTREDTRENDIGKEVISEVADLWYNGKNGYIPETKYVPITRKGFFFCDSFGFKAIDTDMSNISPVEGVRCLMLLPGKAPEEIYVPDRLDAWQNAVSDHGEESLMEVTYPFDDNAVIVGNEEAKLIPMQGNRHIGGQVYAGPLFIVGDNGMGEFCDLTDKQVEKYKELFADPEDISPEEVESDFGYYITGI